MNFSYYYTEIHGSNLHFKWMNLLAWFCNMMPWSLGKYCLSYADLNVNTFYYSTEDPSRYLSKKDIQMANRDITDHWANANQNHSKILPQFVRMAIIKKITKMCWWGCGEEEILVHCWRECKFMETTMENSMENPQKIKKETTV